MLFNGQVAGMDARILLDSGASHNFLSGTYAEAAGIPSGNAAQREEVILPDGGSLKSIGEAALKVKLGGFAEKVPCSIVDLGIPVDLVVGSAWLTKHKAVLNFANGSVTLWKGNRMFRLNARVLCNVQSTCMEPSRQPNNNLQFLSAMQAKRAVRRGCKSFLIAVTEVTEAKDPKAVKPQSSGFANDMQILLEQYQDVFATELPKGFRTIRMRLRRFLWNLDQFLRLSQFID